MVYEKLHLSICVYFRHKDDKELKLKTVLSEEKKIVLKTADLVISAYLLVGFWVSFLIRYCSFCEADCVKWRALSRILLRAKEVLLVAGEKKGKKKNQIFCGIFLKKSFKSIGTALGLGVIVSYENFLERNAGK